MAELHPHIPLISITKHHFKYVLLGKKQLFSMNELRLQGSLNTSLVLVRDYMLEVGVFYILVVISG